MEEKQDNPIWSLVVWGAASTAAASYGLWGVNDGWINPIKNIEFNRWVATPVGFAVALWCVWKGVKEYRKVKSKPEGEGPAPEQGAGAAGSVEQEKKS